MNVLIMDYAKVTSRRTRRQSTMRVFLLLKLAFFFFFLTSVTLITCENDSLLFPLEEMPLHSFA